MGDQAKLDANKGMEPDLPVDEPRTFFVKQQVLNVADCSNKKDHKEHGWPEANGFGEWHWRWCIGRPAHDVPLVQCTGVDVHNPHDWATLTAGHATAPLYCPGKAPAKRSVEERPTVVRSTGNIFEKETHQ